ncbi:MAG TPA: hypothetical protein EYH38_08390 [Leucothrix sp.]|nr:hypothetical protein [Leucothrix sp.]
MKKLLLFIILLSFSLSSMNALAKDSLIGSWASSKIQLKLKSNHNYTYAVKILGVKKAFKGSWSTKTITKKNGKKAKILILRYNLFGKRKKVAEYSFKKGRLKLIQNGKVHYLKRK